MKIILADIVHVFVNLKKKFKKKLSFHTFIFFIRQTQCED